MADQTLRQAIEALRDSYLKDAAFFRSQGSQWTYVAEDHERHAAPLSAALAKPDAGEGQARPICSGCARPTTTALKVHGELFCPACELKGRHLHFATPADAPDALSAEEIRVFAERRERQG